MAQGNGWPVWYELIAPDAATVTPFYRATLGWEIAEEGMPLPNGSNYRTIARADGGSAGGLLTLTSDMAETGMKPAWLGYFYADDVDALCARAQTLGATIAMPPTDLPAAGRIAMLIDPQGAAFYLIKPIPPEGQPDAQSDVFASDVVGRCCWNELNAPDALAAIAFYSELFDWSMDDGLPMTDGHVFRFIDIGGVRIGAVGERLKPGDRAAFTPYFRGADIHAMADAVPANGGSLISAPHDIPDEMVFSATDPAGARVSFMAKKGA